MEVCTFPHQGLADMYLIQGAETNTNPQFTGRLENTQAMYNEGAPEYYVDQGLYYTNPAGYGYIGTGYEPVNDWEEYHGVFGQDGQDVQFIGAHESLPYLYYVPGYGYGQSSLNPYNPYIPGAGIGAEGSFVAPQYYALPSYESSAVLPAYQPVVHQSRSNNMANGVADTFSDKGLSGNQAHGQNAKHNLSSNIHRSSRAVADSSSTERNTLTRAADGSRANNGPFKQPVPSYNSGSFPSQSAAQVFNARGAQGRENGSTELSLVGNQLRSNLPSTTGSSGCNSIDLLQSSANKVRPKIALGRVPDDLEGNHDFVSEQNQEPTNKSKNQIVVKARSTMAGNADAQGNITIFVDEYNRVEFPTDYNHAKFFVIKSYSEDDVHKSIKYNVWSSTPNGNKKLNAAYEGAQRIAAGDPRGCPVFLFFSVNASGQFCGVAEMTGPVDFNKDMDFWQQDKWSGCFPVKWHFVKDLPNPNFRHIILENNDNKPVTNSRDTTEIPYKKGLEMLRIFKYHMLKSSLLDDFMYYENRQRIMQEERTRLLTKSFENPHHFPLLDHPRKLQPTHDFSSIGDVHGKKRDEDDLINQNKSNVAPDEKGSSSVENVSVPQGKATATRNINNVAQDEKESSSVKNPSVPLGQVTANSKTRDSRVGSGNSQVLADELKVSSLSIDLQKPKSKCDSSTPTTSASAILNNESAGVVTIGSMPVQVKDIGSTFLTVGTIPLDPKALQKK